MYGKVKKYIDQYSMIQKSESVILGISGGADSVCLLYLLKQYLYEQSGEDSCNRLKAIHVHHGIRGTEADRDMEFVKQICKRENIELSIRYYDVPQYSREQRISCEEAGRQLRYQAMRELAGQIGNGKNVKIAVAHNRNDNAETVMHNLCRGTGVRGMSGIAPVNGMIIRPLLVLSRNDIENYLSDNKISYIIDSTNLETEYTRNKIRLQVLPFLQREINPKSVEHISNAAENIREAEEYLEKLTAQMYETAVYTDNNYICIGKEQMNQIDVYMRKRIIRRAIAETAGSLKDITQVHIEDVLAIMKAETGKYIYLPDSVIVRNDYTRLILEKKEPDTVVGHEATRKSSDLEIRPVETIIDKPGIYALDGYEYCFEVSEIFLNSEQETVKFLENCIKNQENLYTKWFDYDKMKFTVRLRYRMAGDYLTVDSRFSHKKLKSYFVDKKIPQIERNRIPLLADGNHIIWVIGHRISEEYKITESTRHILKIERKGKI